MRHIFHGFALKMKFTFVNNQKRALSGLTKKWLSTRAVKLSISLQRNW